MDEFNFDGDTLTQEQIPEPTGWRIVLGRIYTQNKSAGGIIMTSDIVKQDETQRFVAQVLKMGPLCYKADRFKEHPNAQPVKWCEVGDIVSIGQYTGSTLPCKDATGKLFKLKVVNDDEINCVISDISILNLN